MTLQYHDLSTLTICQAFGRFPFAHLKGFTHFHMSNWDSLEAGTSSGKYLKLVEGDNRIRIVSDVIKVWKRFNGKGNKAKTYMTQEAANLDPESQEKFEFYVIDRVDGKIKQAEVGVMIFNQIKFIRKNPDYKFEGIIFPYDLTISKSGSGFDIVYATMPSPKLVPLTGEENLLVSNLEDLKTVIAKDAEDVGVNPPPVS